MVKWPHGEFGAEGDKNQLRTDRKRRGEMELAEGQKGEKKKKKRSKSKVLDGDHQ